jgi:bacterioferritin-associated ferredoxin
LPVKVIHGDAFGNKFEDAAHHLHVGFGPVRFTELPDIDNIAVKDKHFGFDAFQVLQEFFGVASVCAKCTSDITTISTSRFAIQFGDNCAAR